MSGPRCWRNALCGGRTARKSYSPTAATIWCILAIRLLEQARGLGDVLVLALNTDASVKRYKGPDRPILCESDRAEIACALEAVDAVTLFDEDTPRELIAELLPDVLIKGADWSHFIAGREEVEAAGGTVMPLALEPGHSTTGILEAILAKVGRG
jgi:rfaE bifunctional protein nucleotidyltransferase chain/domain